MNFDAFLSNYETEARTKRADAISFEIESYLGFKTGSVMDFGCKTGLVAFKLKNKVNELLLVDSSQELIQAADYRLDTELNTNINTHCGDILKTDFTKKFDVIYTSLALHHEKDLQPILNKLVSYLKKNGKLIVIELLPNNGKLHEGEQHFQGHHGFKIESMTKMLEVAGLNEIMGRKFYSSYERINDANLPYSLFSIIGEKA